jgi:sulfatase maturation enzyme AslB (radical SAM superfamily)
LVARPEALLESGVEKDTAAAAADTALKGHVEKSLVDAGEFTTFSPELLGMRSDAYGTFCLGNVLTDSPRAIARSKTLQHLFKEVQAGVRLCEDTCQYFDLCGDGAPSNKLFETGTFATAVTRFCTDSIQLPLRIVLEDLETTLAQGRSNCSNIQLSSGSSFKTSP